MEGGGLISSVQVDIPCYYSLPAKVKHPPPLSCPASPRQIGDPHVNGGGRGCLGFLRPHK